MEVEIFSNSFYKVLHNQEKQYMMGVWNKNSEFISDEDYLLSLNQLGELLKTHKPLYFLDDERHRLHTISVKLQPKLAHMINKQFGIVGVRKFAVIKPDDLIAELAGLQTKDELNNPCFETEYFINKFDALNWFRS